LAEALALAKKRRALNRRRREAEEKKKVRPPRPSIPGRVRLPRPLPLSYECGFTVHGKK
jgi:hypothetical protein